MKGRPSTKQTHLTSSRLGTKAQTRSSSAKASISGRPRAWSASKAFLPGYVCLGRRFSRE
ncbi:unnamed protein product [Ixodes persulcatus]